MVLGPNLKYYRINLGNECLNLQIDIIPLVGSFETIIRLYFQ